MRVLGELYRRQGRTDEAEALLTQCPEVEIRVLGEAHTDTLRTMLQLGLLYQQQGRTDEAEAQRNALLVASRSANADTLNLIAWESLAMEPADLREPRTALKFALRANELTNNQNSRYLITLALAYHLTGDAAKAIETQKRAISLMPDKTDEATRAEFEATLRTYEAAVKAQEGGSPEDGDDR